MNTTQESVLVKQVIQKELDNLQEIRKVAITAGRGNLVKDLGIRMAVLIKAKQKI